MKALGRRLRKVVSGFSRNDPRAAGRGVLAFEFRWQRCPSTKLGRGDG